MNNMKSCCDVKDIDYNSLSKSFFSQFDPNNDYTDCDLFSNMKKDFSELCKRIASDKELDLKPYSCDEFVEKFFESYKSIDKYLNCHLADSMKAEMKKMCGNFDDYYAVLLLTADN